MTSYVIPSAKRGLHLPKFTKVKRRPFSPEVQRGTAFTAPLQETSIYYDEHCYSAIYIYLLRYMHIYTVHIYIHI